MRTLTVSALEQRIKEARTFRCDLLLVYNDLTDATAENNIPRILEHLRDLEQTIIKLKRVLNGANTDDERKTVASTTSQTKSPVRGKTSPGPK